MDAVPFQSPDYIWKNNSYDNLTSLLFMSCSGVVGVSTVVILVVVRKLAVVIIDPGSVLG